MEKGETKFSQRLHRALPECIYVLKTHNPYYRGIPDFYYEAPTGEILWAEHKLLLAKPDRNMSASELGSDTPSWHAQQRWMLRARNNGINVRTIVGIKGLGAYVLRAPFFLDVEKEELHDYYSAAYQLCKILKVTPPRHENSTKYIYPG